MKRAHGLFPEQDEKLAQVAKEQFENTKTSKAVSGGGWQPKKVYPVPSGVKNGDTVYHKTYGIGSVYEMNEAKGHIHVQFPSVGTKLFQYPAGFRDGFLSMDGKFEPLKTVGEKAEAGSGDEGFEDF